MWIKFLNGGLFSHFGKKGKRKSHQFYLADTKFKLITTLNFHSSVGKCGSKAGRRGTNANVHSWFSAMSTCQPFIVPLVSAFIKSVDTKFLQVVHMLCSGFRCDSHNKQVLVPHTALTLNISSLGRQSCLPSRGPRRTPWFLCNFSTVWCSRLVKLCFLGFWNYNSVIQALLISNILCLFISTEVSH